MSSKNSKQKPKPQGIASKLEENERALREGVFRERELQRELELLQQEAQLSRQYVAREGKLRGAVSTSMLECLDSIERSFNET